MIHNIIGIRFIFHNDVIIASNKTEEWTGRRASQYNNIVIKIITG